MGTKMFSSSYSHFKTSHPLQVFPAKPSQPSSSSALTSMKMKNLIHTLIVSHVCRIIRALSKVKTAIVEIILRQNNSNNIHNRHGSSRIKKIIMGSFRLHYNWSASNSSHILPVPSRVYEGLQGGGGGDNCHDSELAGYLQWLEENVHDEGSRMEKGINEIDKLAEIFIANCHDKFRLEKQDSDRKFHEMLARGL
ncbi:uncharacterized protein LOC130721488 [Lotus japonicus]|uniref:uncharacterized protein LOC130721488 n=1 Tax=Lotus japonicus TaxID=34305 RepID=UPI00258BF164|nr:uncharacterized protein LOC130721488 [Lotus japonicus]